MMAKRLKCSPEKAISELDRIVYSGLEKKFETIKDNNNDYMICMKTNSGEHWNCISPRYECVESNEQ